MTPYPPFYRGPALCHSSCDFQSEGGANRLAGIIREAWRACGVVVPIRIDRQEQGPSDKLQHRPMHLVRVELVGGLPGRVG